MTVRQIRFFGDPVLRTVCSPIDSIDDGVRQLVRDLMDTVQLDGRAGVAATQIGHTQRAFSYKVDDQEGYLLNPELVSVEGEPVPTGEGCLSVPGLWFDVLRYPRATVRGTDLDGNVIELTGEGTLAQAFQHECDHLDGKLYIHRLEGEDRREAMKQIRQSDWF
ncbi:peptide deformylase [Leucobacter sp. M11]|uniref:peptide deformylase n=1 Tax=Leucobacter sp. M11 TaxID=2993565 RepID=UPI002D7EC6F7|nr:peptide deformylase [Leucobacter sp. M11]MEB4616552.1 peptide deformylase [Leucobacter sp. M11]